MGKLKVEKTYIKYIVQQHLSVEESRKGFERLSGENKNEQLQFKVSIN